ncbi:MAG: HdeD family acid-resistance protein [Verrucomicrobia bacterium]|nr:HdeD family acid-resistance protein [Verrucomicrobiota bacterium]
MDNGDLKKQQLLEAVRKNKALLLSEGVAFTLLGLFALAAPTIFSLTLSYFFGWGLVVGALILGVRVVRAPDIHNRIVSILSILLYLFLGFMFLFYPVSGVETLTLVLGIFFIFDSIFKFYTSAHLRGIPGRSWILSSGIVSIVLAILILASWPTNTPWVLGVVLGVNFLVTGLATLGFFWQLPHQKDD